MKEPHFVVFAADDRERYNVVVKQYTSKYEILSFTTKTWRAC